MFGLKTLERHADLFGRMAEAVDVDVSAAVTSGRLPAAEFRGAVLSCSGCEAPNACEGWHRLHPDGADSPPGYCRNRALLGRLSAE